MKIKVGSVDMGIVINCLDQMRRHYADDVQKEIDETILSLIEIYDHMKPGRRRKIRITPAEYRIIIQCLNDWRNLFLSDGDSSKAEAVGETILAFCQ